MRVVKNIRHKDDRMKSLYSDFVFAYTMPININSAGNLEIILVRATSSQQLIDRSKKQLKEQKNWPYLQGGKSTSRKKIRHSCPIMSLLLYLWDIAYFEGAFFRPIFLKKNFKKLHS